VCVCHQDRSATQAAQHCTSICIAPCVCQPEGLQGALGVCVCHQDRSATQAAQHCTSICIAPCVCQPEGLQGALGVCVPSRQVCHPGCTTLHQHLHPSLTAKARRAQLANMHTAVAAAAAVAGQVHPQAGNNLPCLSTSIHRTHRLHRHDGRTTKLILNPPDE
jgi:hypothetical protein